MKDIQDLEGTADVVLMTFVRKIAQPRPDLPPTHAWTHRANITCQIKQLLYRNVQRFRGGLVFKAHRLSVSFNSRLESNKEEGCGMMIAGCGMVGCGMMRCNGHRIACC